MELTLTAEDDTQLRLLAESFDGQLRSATAEDRTGRLLIHVREPGKAEKLYHHLLVQAVDQANAGHINNQSGDIKYQLDDYTGAINFYEAAADRYQRTVSQNQISLVTYYNNIDRVNQDTEEYSEALAIRHAVLPLNYHDISSSYNSIVLSYHSLGEYSKALSFC